MKSVTINPGELYVATEPTNINTLLGSCVSVCIFDTETLIGGMNHYMLPDTTDQASDIKAPNKYGGNAIKNLLKEFKRLNCKPKNLVAKIVGGGNVVDALNTVTPNNIGYYNIEIARKMLAKFNIPIIAENVGGLNGRKVEFISNTGEVRLKKINRTDPNILKPEKSPKIKVLIVDDSRPVRLMLRKILESTKDIEVVGEANDPYEAADIRKRNQIDVMTLDINMPKMDGITYLRQFMPSNPIPTIVISNYALDEYPKILEALEAGAFDHLGKPGFEGIEEYAQKLCEKIRTANIAKKQICTVKHSVASTPKSLVSIPNKPYFLESSVLAIGASTGGTEAIKEVLVRLPADVPPIIIVQHIPPVFSKAFADRLNTLCKFAVKEAETGDELKCNLALVAPGNKHMKIIEIAGKLKVELTDDEQVNRFRPSVDYMFKSLAKAKKEKRNLNMVAVLLTGMGCDGAQGLFDLKQLGAQTIAQDEQSSVVFGMPREAIALNAAIHVTPLLQIAQKISECFFNFEKNKLQKTA